MAECITCKKYTKYRNGYCSSCYHNNKSRLSKTKNESSSGRFPSHTELYRDIHKIEKSLVLFLFKLYGVNTYSSSGLFKKKYVPQEFDIKIEEGNWDLIIELLGVVKTGKEYLSYPRMCVEYKSSINEWGKQIDAFFRQIKSRKKVGCFSPVLLTFDPEFEPYENACKRAGISLIILPEEFLLVLRGKSNDDELYNLWFDIFQERESKK